LSGFGLRLAEASARSGRAGRHPLAASGVRRDLRIVTTHITLGDALGACGVDRTDARILLAHVLGASHAAIVAHPERVLAPDEHARLRALIERRRRGEPVAYLVGEREFYGRGFRVGPEVLIPRPETELLVEAALERLPAERSARVLDLGTGSGVVAITIARERSSAEVTATDRSVAALAVARGNADLHAAGNVRFLAGDWYEAVAGRRFDLVVANPPYVAEHDPHLGEGDLRFEPRAALVGGPDGLAAIRRIVAGARAHLVSGGWLLFEHGCDQGLACTGLLADAGFNSLVCLRDLAGHERVSGGCTPAA